VTPVTHKSLRFGASLAGAAAVALALVPAAVGDTALSSSPGIEVSDQSVSSSQATPTSGTLPLGKAGAAATLEQCATAAAPQTERSATFAGEMTVGAGIARMEMRIDVEEMASGGGRYRTVSALGLGVWQRSSVGVKSFTHIQQVTNLSAPAVYRGAIHFRWLNARGRVIKVEELHTASCEQPAPSAPAPATG
jgi:hypothetical protein